VSAVPAELAEKLCKRCQESLPASQFSRTASTSDGYSTVCKPCRTPTVLTDPEVAPDVLSCRAFEYVLTPEELGRIHAGGNYRVTLSLHVLHAEEPASGRPPRWISRWSEVISFDG
jgi:hypothetical protein